MYNDKKHIVPDADNLDTKIIIDALTDHLHGGDGAKYCSFSSCSAITSAITKSLSEGTYFTVSNTFGQIEPIDIRLQEISSIFAKETKNCEAK